MSRVAKNRQAGVAKGCPTYRTISGASPTLVFARRHIANPVQTMLDAPVASIEIQKVLRIGSIGSQAGDRVRDFLDRLIANDPRSLVANRLGKAWPVKKATESAAGLKVKCTPLMRLTNPRLPTTQNRTVSCSEFDRSMVVAGDSRLDQRFRDRRKAGAARGNSSSTDLCGGGWQQPLLPQ
ncbi:hypothetical protein CA13_03450 [Planctomycetes bacterium CA13]|uniref:Uncharacterized protein n=1 Tax=Novipirellula herctigrandis TaxID=2527986 RepID=A0A5C5YVA9_9BACT|nr:hypothetical protein CA13_03450 [Planctomycetes bacterium CA13]